MFSVSVPALRPVSSDKIPPSGRFGRGGMPGEDDFDFDFLLSHASVKNYRRHQEILGRGDRNESLFLIISGRVESYIHSDTTRTLVGRKGAGEYFGELSLLAGLPSPTSIVTLEDSRLGVIPRLRFQECIAERPNLWLTLVGELSHAVVDATERLSMLGLDAYGRLRFNLYRLACERDAALVVEGLWTQQQLAELAGCTRETIAKLMAALKRGRWISCDRSGITLLKTLPMSF